MEPPSVTQILGEYEGGKERFNAYIANQKEMVRYDFVWT